MPMFKFGSATVVEPNISLQRWSSKISYDKESQVRVAKDVYSKYAPNKYLLSHVTIIAAVETEQADLKDKKSKYLIHPEFSKFVNNNGDAWSKEVLANTYKTFIGAQNYLEHVQIPELSKGRIIDAVLREIAIGKNEKGEDLSTYYVDILVATDKKHGDLVRKIESGELGTLSMGCLIKHSTCSQCGKKAKDESEACLHVRYMKGNTFYDKNGVKRITAELCGSEDEPDSVTFIEASWVRNPAFKGAVIRNIVEPPKDVLLKFEEASKKEAYEIKEGDYMKAAHVVAKDDPEAPPAEEPTPEEPADKPEEAPAAEPAPEETPAAPEAPGGDAPAEPAPEEMAPEEDDVTVWKKNIKRQVMDELTKDIVKEFSGPVEESRPQELETLDETLIKPASTLKTIRKSNKLWDNYIKRTTSSLNNDEFKKLKYGSYILLTSSIVDVLSKYGYNRRDFLAVMSYLDNLFNEPLPTNIKKAVAKLNGTNGLSNEVLLKDVVGSIGRKVTKKEAKRILSWLKWMDLYEK